MHATAGLMPWLMLLSTLGCAVWMDCRHRQVPNRLVVTSLILGLLWQLTGPAGAWTFDADAPGATGLAGFLMGAGGLLVALMPLHLLRVMGGGDIKLLVAIGGWCGVSAGHWSHLPGIVLAVLVAGGLLAVVRMMVLGISMPVMTGVLRLASSPLNRRGPRGEPHVTADRMPYAVAIALGTLGYLFARAMRWVA